MANIRLCRICISQSESPVLMSIFGKDALWKKITSLANVHIEEGDSLPQEICLVCAKNAIDACLFKQKCEEADSYFRKQLLKRMELRLPNDTEIISISSGLFNMNGGGSLGGMQQQQSSLPSSMMDSLTARIIKKDDNHSNTGNASIMQHQQQQQQQNDQHSDDYDVDNFPTLMEDSAEELSNDENPQQPDWHSTGSNMDIGQNNSLSNDKYDDSLPLIPEIELITPNDDDDDDDEDAFKRNLSGEYQCNVCFKCFAMKSILKHHIKNCHPETNPMYECYECKKTYLSKRFLEKHIRMGRCVKKRKNTTRPMQCSECRTLFPTGHHLGWHKRTGSCRSRSPKLSLTEYEQKNDSETNEENENGGDNNEFNTPMSGRERKKKLGKYKTRGGRTRIKLDAKKIAYATELVKQQVSTTKFAQELKISRTFAWRLRKTLENNMYKEGKWCPIKPTATPISKIKPNLIPNQGVFNKEAIGITTINPININSVLKTDDLIYKPATLNEKELLLQQQQQQQLQQKMFESKNNQFIMDKNFLMQQQQQQQAFNGPLAAAAVAAFYQNMMQVATSLAIETNKIINHQKNDNNSSTTIPQLNDNNQQFSSVEEIKNITKISEIKKEINDTNITKNEQNDKEAKENNNKEQNENEDSDTSEVEEESQQELNNSGGNDQNAMLQPSSSNVPYNMNNNKVEERYFNTGRQLRANVNYSSNRYKKKPRKPNVFIDEDKLAKAKILVANNASTQEIARTLDVSQMSAWKLRDHIQKNIPLKVKKPQSDSQLSLTAAIATATKTIKSQTMITSSLTAPLSAVSATTTTKLTKINKPKMNKIKVPRKRLKRDERVQRDKIITKEILQLIKEDNSIQYWKVSERLAEKGYSLSPSSVCQRLKSMGIHRRSRQNEQLNKDNDNEQYQQNDNNNSSDDNDNDDNDDIGGNEDNYGIEMNHSHFLKAHFNNLA